MAKRDEFDDEGFFDSLLKRNGNTALPVGLRRIFIIVGVFIVLSILVSVIWSSLSGGSDRASNGPVPIIRADTTPFKIKPEDPGGMDVPNKDSTIFETLKGEKEESKVENLLEDDGDKAAVAREKVASKVEKKTEPLVDVRLERTGTPPDTDLEDAPPQPVIEKPPVAKPAPKAAARETETASIIDTLKEEAKPPEASKPKAEPKPEAVKPAAGGGNKFIQLASVKSEADAKSQWAGFKSKNPELANLSLHVQKADLGAKGIYYRIQAGPLSPEDATKTCSAVKSRGGSCIVAK